ncbi:MAG TPA: GNAT family N-acetyltransferase [Actinomycetota bacterium]|nr:GNAT family N-acetyltransferase [Actinomycetota bacterium]
MTSPAAALERIHAYILEVTRPLCTVKQVGSFDLLLHRKLMVPWASAAVPRLGTTDWTQHLDHVAEAFGSAGRSPRWEFIRELFPGLAEDLASAGFGTPTIEPLLALDSISPVDAAQISADVAIRPFDSDLDDAAEVVELVQSAFDSAADAAALEAFRSSVAAPNVVQLIALSEERPVGSGRMTHHRGVAEITGVAVVKTHRRQGIGSALTKLLTRAAIELGSGIVYLTARDEGAGRIYERLGFARIGSYVEV